jgi:hypothetical protein
MSPGAPASVALMKTALRSVVLSLTAFLLVGCGSTIQGRSQKLSLGMTRQEAIKVMGKDYVTVAARAEQGNKVEVIQYADKKSDPLFLYFRDDDLVQWGDTQVLGNMPQE